MSDTNEAIKLMNAKLDSILSLLDILVRKSDLVNDEDDDEMSETKQAISIRSIHKGLSLNKDINH